MKVVIQRVTYARVTVDNETVGQIGQGLAVLVGIDVEDSMEDVKWLAEKTVGLRIFNDDCGKMNLSVKQVGGDVLAISQFTLLASTSRGNRPSYIRAARPETAVPLYTAYCHNVEALLGKPVQKGIFGADMKVELLNDGPVTIVIDSQHR